MVLTMTTDEMSQALKEIMKTSNNSNDDSRSLFCSIWTPRRLEDSQIYTFWPPATGTTAFRSHEVDGHLNDTTMSLNGKTCNVGTHLHDTTDRESPTPRLTYAGAALSSPATPTSFLKTKILIGTQKFDLHNTNEDGKIESMKTKTPTSNHLTPTNTRPVEETIVRSYKTALFSTPKRTTHAVLSPLVRRRPSILQSPLEDHHRSIPAYERSLLPPGILSSPVIDDEMYFPSDLLDMDDSYSTITVSCLDGSHATSDGSFFVRPDSFDEGQVEVRVDVDVEDEATQIKGDDSSWGNIELKSDEEDKENLQPCLDCGIWKSLNEFSVCTDDDLNAGICLACEWKPATKKTKARRRHRDSKGSATKSQPRRALATLSADKEQKQKQLQLQKERYKTKLCVNFMKRNNCPYGPACIFAHGKKELRAEPQL